MKSDTDQIKWYQKPVAAIGAASMAYHEVLRGRRTGTCRECGRLNHATSELCLCGGEVEENEHPDPSTEEYDTAAYDSYEDLSFKLAVPAVKLLLTALTVVLVFHAVETTDYIAALGAVVLASLFGSVW